jgi:hypothetical protein
VEKEVIMMATLAVYSKEVVIVFSLKLSVVA